MDYYCDVCDKFIKPKSKYNHFEPNTHKKFDKCKQMELTIENLDINYVDEIFYAYIIKHNKEFDYYLTKCHFKLIFSDNQFSTYVKPNLFDNKTKTSWQNFLEKKLMIFFKKIGYNFNHIEEMNILTISKKWIGHKISILNIFCTRLDGN